MEFAHVCISQPVLGATTPTMTSFKKAAQGPTMSPQNLTSVNSIIIYPPPAPPAPFIYTCFYYLAKGLLQYIYRGGRCSYTHYTFNTFISIYLSIYLYIYLSGNVYVYLSIFLAMYESIKVSIC